MKRWLLILSIVFIVVGIIGMLAVNFFYFRPFSSRRGGFRRGPGFISKDFDTNGQQIYFTGISRTESISSNGGPIWFQMHGGGCVVCHGADGKGGRVVTMMGSFTAPDIRIKTLIKEKLTVKLIKRAITEGKDEKGENLNPNMPHWSMSNEDLNNIILFLKNL